MLYFHSYLGILKAFYPRQICNGERYDYRLM